MTRVTKVLFFSPFAFIWPHALPEFQLAQLLAEAGFDIKVLGCRKSYARMCTAMESARVDLDADPSVKDAICKRCIQSSTSLHNAFNVLPFATVEDYAGPGVESLEIPQTTDEIVSCSIDGIPVGRLSLYETLIKFKKNNMDLAPKERRYFEAFFLNAVTVLHQATAAIRAEKPDVVVCYSPQYVIPGIFAAVARREGVRTVFIEGSSNDVERYSHLRMWDWDAHGLNQPAMAVPERFDDYVLSAEAAARAKRVIDLRAKAVAFSTYTSAAKNADPYEVFGLDRDRKYILLAMSSYDEVYSGYMIDKLPLERFEGRVFRDQAEWLRETVSWVAGHPELQIVVRPHPREFPNRRDGVASPHQQEWAAVIDNLPANVRIDHPDRKFSLYDHLAHIDVLITGWSSTGVEALTKGVPVVTYDRELPTFSPSIQYTGTTKEEYFANILKACEDTDAARHIREATRWLAYTFETGTVEVGGRFNDRWRLHRGARRLITERLSRRLDTLFPPSRRDIGRIAALIRGEGTSLFDLPEK